MHEELPLLYLTSSALRGSSLASRRLVPQPRHPGSAESIVGYRAKKNSLPIDFEQIGELQWHDYWEPVHPERGGRIVLEPEVFYLLLSAEGVSIPPSYAAEMLAYDPTAGELRTHYAGFFDPGFGYSRTSAARTAPRSRCARATCRSWSSTASRSASSRSSAWQASQTCSTGRTSAPTTRASRRC